MTEPHNLPPAPGLADTTLRQIVHVSIGGKRLRVQFSNAFGTAPLKLNAAHIAVSAGNSAIKPETDRALTFHGQPSVIIPTGAMMVSDPIDFDLAPLSDLVVTIHINDPSTVITGHPGSRCTSYVQAGNAVAAADLSTAATTEHWYYLSGVDVLTTNTAAAVAILGDSITDGRGSTTDANRHWPDNLARRLQTNPHTNRVAVLNHGIGGNALLRGGLGPNALARLDRDVLAQPGVRWLIVLEGINDLGGKVSAHVLIAAYEQVIIRARDRNIRVYGATIMPCGQSFYFNPELEAARQTVNYWVRTSGAFDAVIDMDAATRDPHNPTDLVAAVHGGDHLHPNDEGYRIMANAVNLKLFTRR